MSIISYIFEPFDPEKTPIFKDEQEASAAYKAVAESPIAQKVFKDILINLCGVGTAILPDKPQNMGYNGGRGAVGYYILKLLNKRD